MLMNIHNIVYNIYSLVLNAIEATMQGEYWNTVERCLSELHSTEHVD